MSEMTADRALAWLVVGLINEHADWDEPNDGDPLGGGCIVRCGPCGALNWFANNDRGRIDELVRLTGFQQGGWTYWDDGADSLRWDLLEAQWSRHKSCASSNGVLTGCDFSRSEAEGTLDSADTEWIVSCSVDGELGRWPMTVDGHNEAVQAWMDHTTKVHDSPDPDARELLMRSTPADASAPTETTRETT